MASAHRNGRRRRVAHARSGGIGQSRTPQAAEAEGTWDITVWDAPSYFEVRQQSGGVASVASHRVEALEEGRSRLTLSVDMQGWLVPVVGLFSKGMTTRYLTSEAQDIKRAAESAET